MHCNIGKRERVIRFAVAAAMMVVASFAAVAIESRAVFFVLSLIFFVTAWNRSCPVNTLFGLSSQIGRNAHAK